MSDKTQSVQLVNAVKQEIDGGRLTEKTRALLEAFFKIQASHRSDFSPSLVRILNQRLKDEKSKYRIKLDGPFRSAGARPGHNAYRMIYLVDCQGVTVMDVTGTDMKMALAT